MHGDYNDLLEDDIDFGYHHQKKDNNFWLVLLAIVIFGLIMSMMTSCASVQTVDYNRVLQVLMEYKDQIPYDDIAEALKNIK